MPGQQPGYPPPPPGAYPPGYGTVPPSGTSRNTRILVGILAILGVLVMAGVALLVILVKTPAISLPAPPEYREASDYEIKSVESGMKANSSDTVLDAAYINDEEGSAVIVAHLDTFVADAPPSDDAEAVEEYYQKNKDEIMSGFNLGFDMYSGLDAEVGLYEVERLGCGDMALHIRLDMTFSQTPFAIDVFIITKGSKAFFVTLQTAGYSNTQSVVDFIIENISFK
jgi:hypothetical protein